ncbi:MAG: hypothetical protein P4L61_01200, partial [Candidatus Pacebacteria bacterium]|nr:hypothetical protein [Candidatus Paceibacterota bacterium]
LFSSPLRSSHSSPPAFPISLSISTPLPSSASPCRLHLASILLPAHFAWKFLSLLPESLGPSSPLLSSRRRRRRAVHSSRVTAVYTAKQARHDRRSLHTPAPRHTEEEELNSIQFR